MEAATPARVKPARATLPIVRYGKPSLPFMDLARPFFDPAGQDVFVEESQRIYEIYRRQPPRTACKNCCAPLAPAAFVKQEIPYHLCGGCGHLSGHYEDSEPFYRAMFSDNGGAVVAGHYAAPDRAAFDARVEVIYRPKMDFLADVLAADGVDPTRLSYADIGTGLGHFVQAMLDAGIKDCRGYEASQALVDQGNAILGGKRIELLSIPDLDRLVPELEAEVVTMVFVLEHLIDPRGIVEALKRNPAVRYLLVAVPVHSPSCYIELMFPTVYERHLSGHTHLYTDRSLRWLCDAVGLERIGEWWFGADAMDLLRSFRTRMHQTKQSPAAIKDWETMMLPVVDGFQRAIDDAKVSSEVHLILKVPR